MSESLGVEVLTLKTDATQFDAGIQNAEKKASGLRGTFAETAKAALGLGKDGKVSLDTLGAAFTNPTAGAKALSLEAGSTLVSGFGAAAVGAVALIGAVVAVGAAFTKAAFDAASIGGALDDASEVTGISVERLSGLKFAAEVTGGSLDQMTNSIFRMQQRMEENPAEFEEGLKRIGLTSRELEDMTLDEKFLAVNAAFRETKPGADQAAAAIALFGKQGRDMIPLLNEDIKGLVDRSRELGLTWSTEDAAAAEDLERATAELGQIWSNLWTGLGNFFIPVLHKIVTVGADVVGSLHGMYENVRLLWGEVRNVPDEIKTPKMWRDLADRGVKPVALSFEEAAKAAKEMDKDIETTQKNAQKRADENKKRIDEENRIREKAIKDELGQRSKLNTHLAKQSDERAADEMKRLADEYLNREKAATDLAEADRRALDGMYQERFRLDQEDAAKTKAAHVEKKRVFQETWDHIKGSLSINFADMLTGTTGFKDGFTNIWRDIKSSVANILTGILGDLTNRFLTGALNALTGSKKSMTGGFTEMLGGFNGVLGGLSDKLNSWLSSASKAITATFRSGGGGGKTLAAGFGGAAAGVGTLAAGGSTGQAIGAVGMTAATAGLGALATGSTVAGSLALGATTMGVGLAAVGVYKGITALKGQKEHKKVNKDRDDWFNDHGGLEGVNQSAQAAGDTDLSTTKAIFAAKKKADFTRAVRDWERVTGRVTAFARGGIVTRPTLGLIGERGPEAVIPLDGRHRMGQQTLNVHMDGLTVAHLVVPHIPRVVDLVVGR